MALPEIVKGTYVDLLLGNADGPPETFTAVCGLTARSFTSQVNTNDTFVPDCADPEYVPIRRLVPTGRQWDLTGEGLLNLAAWRDYGDLADSGATANWRFVIARPAAEGITGTGYYGGPAAITNMQLGGTTGGGEFASVSLTLASDGEWTWTDAT